MTYSLSRTMQAQPDEWWHSGGCGYFAVAMKALWPHLQINVYWGGRPTDTELTEAWHVWAYDPTTNLSYDAHGVHDGPDEPSWTYGPGGEVEHNVDPNKALRPWRAQWHPNEPFADPDIAEAAEVAFDAFGIETHEGSNLRLGMAYADDQQGWKATRLLMEKHPGMNTVLSERLAQEQMQRWGLGHIEVFRAGDPEAVQRYGTLPAGVLATTAHRNGRPEAIILGPDGYNLFVLAHEAAHAVAGSGASHKQAWADAYADLLFKAGKTMASEAWLDIYGGAGLDSNPWWYATSTPLSLGSRFTPPEVGGGYSSQSPWGYVRATQKAALDDWLEWVNVADEWSDGRWQSTSDIPQCILYEVRGQDVHKLGGDHDSRMKTQSGQWRAVREIGRFSYDNAMDQTSGYHFVASRVAYQGMHRPPDPDYGAPLHDLLVLYPADAYTHPHYFDATLGPEYAECWRIAQRVRGNPDAVVPIYRAAPAGLDTAFNDGDWVTISRTYAEQHALYDDDFVVYEASARADQLFTAGDSICEWGYWGSSLPGRTARRRATAGYEELPEGNPATKRVYRGVSVGLATLDRLREAGSAEEMLHILGPVITRGGVHWSERRSYAEGFGKVLLVADMAREEDGWWPRSGPMTDAYIVRDNRLLTLVDVEVNLGDGWQSLMGLEREASAKRTVYRGMVLEVPSDQFDPLYLAYDWEGCARLLAEVASRGGGQHHYVEDTFGVHWTTKQDVAYGFVDTMGVISDGRTTEVGVVFEATVDPADRAEDTTGYGVTPSYYGEAEVPLRVGASVDLTAVWLPTAVPVNPDEDGGYVVIDKREVGFYDGPGRPRSATTVRIPHRRQVTASMLSWRPVGKNPSQWAQEADCLIMTDVRSRKMGRRYEVWVYGRLVGNRQRLDDAKALAEKHARELTSQVTVDWERRLIEPTVVEHYYWGETDEFSDPLTVYLGTANIPLLAVTGSRSSYPPARLKEVLRHLHLMSGQMSKTSLTALTRIEEGVAALDAGADEYLHDRGEAARRALALDHGDDEPETDRALRRVLAGFADCLKYLAHADGYDGPAATEAVDRLVSRAEAVFGNRVASATGRASGLLLAHQGRDGQTRFFLTKRSEANHDWVGYWACPGGGIEDGETPEVAAIREFDEEIGVDPKVLGLTPLGSMRDLDPDTGAKFTTYVAETPRTFAPLGSDEVADWGWFTLDEMRALELHPGVVREMADIRKFLL